LARSKKGLEEYRARRNFDVTPEPAPGGVEPDPDAPTFMIHKHDATRLHYDLRLEIGGALASWSVPKGPSHDPSAKRFAVQTEDHPLEYGNFEGRIPDGEYGAGDSLVWDRGRFDTVPPGQASEQRRKGHLHLELHGEKLEGRWHLVRTGGRGTRANWLFFKARDGLEDATYDVVEARPESVVSGRRVTRGPVTKKDLRAPHPEPRVLMKKVWPPMLATLADADAAPELENHQFEVKYDGYRGLAAVSSGRVCFHTRNGLDLTERFPEVARALSRLVVPEAVLDGEVVAYDARGVSHFESLLTPGADHRFVVFDLLWLQGEDLRGRPLEERRELLESVLANVPPPLELAERLPGDGPEVLALAERRGLEGVIAKACGSRYEGKRSRAWLKLKVSQAQEVAIIGYTPITNGKKEIGALLVGVHDGSGFRYAGKVGTGYSAKVRAQLWRELEADRIDLPPARDAPRLKAARWVRPTKVAQVRFTEWTRDGKLRHPSFLGLRLDKKPEDARREVPEHLPEKGHKRAPRKVAARTTHAPTVELTSGSRLVYPGAKLTKADVFAYYRALAEVMVPALTGRPLALKQWPKGIADAGFFRQNVADLPDWATAAEVEAGKRTVKHPIVDQEETLLWLANRSALELHMWHSRVPHLTEPDWVVFDLDPGKGTFDDLITVALALRGLLEKLGLQSVPKTSGKRGLHVLVPVCRGHNYADTQSFATAITGALGGALPQLATTERSISRRGGRLYLDAMQNGMGKTLIAPYSLRGVEGAPVSAPLRWSEVTRKLDLSGYTLKTMRRRLDKVGDLFAEALNARQRLPRFSR
jgi:bifunctional non-homologous end joining protein LigD